MEEQHEHSKEQWGTKTGKSQKRRNSMNIPRILISYDPSLQAAYIIDARTFNSHHDLLVETSIDKIMYDPPINIDPQKDLQEQLDQYSTRKPRSQNTDNPQPTQLAKRLAVLFKIRIPDGKNSLGQATAPRATAPKFLYFCSDILGSTKYYTITDIMYLMDHGWELTNAMVIGLPNELRSKRGELPEIQIKDLILQSDNKRSVVINCKLIPNFLKALEISPIYTGITQDLVFLYPNALSGKAIQEIKITGTWGKIECNHLDLSITASERSKMSIDTADKLQGLTNVQCLEINNIKELERCFGNKTTEMATRAHISFKQAPEKLIDSLNSHVWVSGNGGEQKGVAGVAGTAGVAGVAGTAGVAGLPPNVLLGSIAYMQNSCNNIANLPSAITLNNSVKQIEKSLETKKPLTITVTSQDTLVTTSDTPKQSQITLIIPTISKINSGTINATVIRKPPTNEDEQKLHKTMTRLSLISPGAQYSPGALIETKDQLRIARALLASLKPTEYKQLLIKALTHGEKVGTGKENQLTLPDHTILQLFLNNEGNNAKQLSITETDQDEIKIVTQDKLWLTGTISKPSEQHTYLNSTQQAMIILMDDLIATIKDGQQIRITIPTKTELHFIE